MFYSLYNAQGGVRSQMGVPRYRLPTNPRLMRKLHMALLLPQDALPFFLLFLSQFLSKWVRIVHVRAAVCEPSQQLLSMVRARCAETPNLSWLLGCPLRLKGSAGVPYESGIRSGRPSLAGPPKRVCFVEGLMWLELSKYLGGRKGSHHWSIRCILESSVMCGYGI